jgi:hypothetical protein
MAVRLRTMLYCSPALDSAVRTGVDVDRAMFPHTDTVRAFGFTFQCDILAMISASASLNSFQLSNFTGSTSLKMTTPGALE